VRTFNRKHDYNHGPSDITDTHMTPKKAYPLRINPEVLQALQRWADDDLRSLNAQIEFVLREALRKNGRLKGATEDNERK